MYDDGTQDGMIRFGGTFRIVAGSSMDAGPEAGVTTPSFAFRGLKLEVRVLSPKHKASEPWSLPNQLTLAPFAIRLSPSRAVPFTFTIAARSSLVKCAGSQDCPCGAPRASFLHAARADRFQPKRRGAR